ncbi:MAG: DUF4293 family protein [Bacteroidota bacterium]|nr:DUF4293 family protein [Bacteroidota bacterium]
MISIVAILGIFLFTPTEFVGFGLLTPVVLKIYFVLTGSLSTLTLILFKRRKTQLSLNRLHSFFQILAAIGLVYEISNTNDLEALLPWLAIPILILILLLLSSNAIKKDEDLIRSIDRLR